METQVKPRIYAGCDKETDAGRCNKPVKLAGREGGFVRCADHPVKKLWPVDEGCPDCSSDTRHAWPCPATQEDE